jgi:hypothetical protein
LAAGLRDGGTMPRYEAGSLRLLINELAELLESTGARDELLGTP